MENKLPTVRKDAVILISIQHKIIISSPPTAWLPLLYNTASLLRQKSAQETYMQ